MPQSSAQCVFQESTLTRVQEISQLVALFQMQQLHRYYLPLSVRSRAYSLELGGVVVQPPSTALQAAPPIVTLRQTDRVAA
jgi:hypothetical protein